MRLSEAIREGGRKIGQEHQVTGIVDDGRGGHCALGAAFLYAFGDARWPMAAEDMDRDLTKQIGQIGCPVCIEWRHDLMRTVVHLNNHHLWTFAQIADWTQAIEAIHGIGQDETHIQREPVRELVAG